MIMIHPKIKNTTRKNFLQKHIKEIKYRIILKIRDCFLIPFILCRPSIPSELFFNVVCPKIQKLEKTKSTSKLYFYKLKNNEIKFSRAFEMLLKQNFQNVSLFDSFFDYGQFFNLKNDGIHLKKENTKHTNIPYALLLTWYRFFLLQNDLQLIFAPHFRRFFKLSYFSQNIRKDRIYFVIRKFFESSKKLRQNIRSYSKHLLNYKAETRNNAFTENLYNQCKDDLYQDLRSKSFRTRDKVGFFKEFEDLEQAKLSNSMSLDLFHMLEDPIEINYLFNKESRFFCLTDDQTNFYILEVHESILKKIYFFSFCENIRNIYSTDTIIDKFIKISFLLNLQNVFWSTTLIGN